ncbi:LPXTG cell wall anchor domain-containing protein [Nakamurella antarctica]|uniref:LPXTG cell wall anchor domain-containing protein n=1 Tax=Nakamurella antarctica TaxID=1902245 RepID=A0A3G8ZY99_9ACTN|nr:LPXTG cell wall anchor domain-containing protein [Nakamurella antarctica]
MPVTGVNVAVWVVLAGVLLLLGAGLLAVSRRRRPDGGPNGSAGAGAGSASSDEMGSI